MKKILIHGLVLGLSGSLLAACGGGSFDTGGSTKPVTDETPMPSCPPTGIVPFLSPASEGTWFQTANVTVSSGTSLVLSPQPATDGSWTWSGCGISGTSHTQAFGALNSCTATATYTNSCGAASSQAFNVTVSEPAPAPVNSFSVLSPNGQITATVTRDGTTGALSYTVKKNGTTLIENSTLGINTNVADFSSGLSFVSRNDFAVDENYVLPGHKKATYNNNSKEMVLNFSKDGQDFSLLVRAYNDGVAYRYRIPGTGAINVLSESSAFNLPDTANGWAENWKANYENTYPFRSDFNSGALGLPLLASVSGEWLLLTESDIGGNYHSSHLIGFSGNNLKVAWPTTISVASVRPFNSPWRAAVIGSLNNIVQSTLTENLNEHSAIDALTWVQPGASAWSWISAGASAADQADYNTHLGYIDIASAMGWKYYLVDDTWQSNWMPDLVAYAKARNVGLWLWVHKNDVRTEDVMRAKLSQWAGWGIRGVKIDFFDDESQATMRLQDTLARVAADNHLMVNFHGTTKPNGLMRKWPNILTQEAVLGAENGNLTAVHNISLVFTRNAIGPMDYTPVIYRNSGGNTTWAHQTALAVAFSSYVQNLADHWASYRASIAKDFLSKVPVVWDETSLLEGHPDQYATVVRRRGSDWYIGALTVGARTAPLPLSFLTPDVTYTAHIYRDGTSVNDIAYETRSVTSASSLNLPLLANGGAAVRITPTQTAPVMSVTYYKIINKNSEKALAIEGASMEKEAMALQWDYVNRTTNDEWRLLDVGNGYVQLLNRNSGDTLDVLDTSLDRGASIKQLPSNGRANQQWKIIDVGGGYSTIVNRNSNQVLDVSESRLDNGAPVVQWTSNNAGSQLWKLIPVQTMP